MSTDRQQGMISRIIEASFRKPGLVVMLLLCGAGVGALWLQDLPRDLFPDLSTPVFNVIVQNAAMGPEELETGVAIPMEVALAGLPHVRRIRSSSQLGVAQVTIEFEPDADYYLSRQLVAERVAQATSSLPPGTEAPLISSLTGRLNEIFEFTLEAEPGATDLMTLRDLAEFEVKNRVLAVPGVAAVERMGGYLRQFQVLLDPERMAVRGVSLQDVEHAVDGANVNASGGFIVQGSLEWTVRAIGRAESVEDLRSTVVTLRGGTPVVLSDVAEVREAPAVRRGLAHRLAGEVVSCRVAKQFGADTVKVAAGVRAAIEEIQAGLPKDVTLRIVYDQSQLVRGALGGVGRAVLIGAAFVVLVIFGLLWNVRAALVVTLSLPLSLLLAGLFLKPAGVGINTMTLGGLAIAVGLLVDAAIIVVENMVHRLNQHGSSPSWKREAMLAAEEVGRPIAFATLILLAVFVPLFAMSGIEGRMYRPLAAAVIASLAASLIVAVTLIPVVAASVLRPRATQADEDVAVIRWLKRFYAPLLDWCLARPLSVLAISACLAFGALGASRYVGSDFMPRIDEGALLLQTILPPEASLDEVDRMNHRIEDELRKVTEVVDVVRRTGRAERSEDPMPHTVSDVLVVLETNRKRSIAQIEAEMRERTGRVPGVSVLYTTPLGMRIDEGLGGTPADLSVRIFGTDLDELARLGEKAGALISEIPGVADLRVEKLTGLPQIRVTVDRAAVARAGLTPGDVIDAIRVGMAGDEHAEIWRGQRRFDLVLRLEDRWRGNIDALGSLLIDVHDGTKVPLSKLAAIERTFGPGAVRREAGSRRIAVEAGVVGRDLGSTAAEVRETLTQRLTLPTGYFVDVGGRIENQVRAARALGVAIGVALLAVFVLLYLALGTFREAFVIVATLPIALVGGVVALLMSGETWNVSSLVGLIGLLGIAVQNGLVLVTQTRALIIEGRSFEAAVREASLGRVRPKLMTAATATLGLLPLLLFHLHGTEIERPLAVVMVGGLVTSTLFTLLALPTFYALAHGAAARFRARSTA